MDKPCHKTSRTVKEDFSENQNNGGRGFVTIAADIIIIFIFVIIVKCELDFFKN